jgi:hypothetical protein
MRSADDADNITDLSLFIQTRFLNYVRYRPVDWHDDCE